MGHIGIECTAWQNSAYHGFQQPDQLEERCNELTEESTVLNTQEPEAVITGLRHTQPTGLVSQTNRVLIRLPSVSFSFRENAELNAPNFPITYTENVIQKHVLNEDKTYHYFISFLERSRNAKHFKYIQNSGIRLVQLCSFSL